MQKALDSQCTRCDLFCAVVVNWVLRVVLVGTVWCDDVLRIPKGCVLRAETARRSCMMLPMAHAAETHIN